MFRNLLTVQEACLVRSCELTCRGISRYRSHEKGADRICRLESGEFGSKMCLCHLAVLA
jgi:hypothetical protein